MKHGRTSWYIPILCVALPAAVCVSWGPAAAAPAEVSGKVTDVILYQGQALVTREIALEAAPGSLEVVVGGLPDGVVSTSLFAEGGQSVAIRAIRFRSRAVGEEPREEVRKLDTALEEITEKIEINKKGQEFLKKRLQYLDKLESFVAPTAEVELSRGVLDAEELEKITNFSFQRRQAVAEDEIRLAAEAKALGKELKLLNRKRAELASSSSRSVREAVLFLEKTAPAAQIVRLSYLVNNCGWSPSYAFRADADGKNVRVEYSAMVQQLTGEDWSKVRLTLSTASPALSAAGPGLGPFYVALSATPSQQPQQEVPSGSVVSQLKTIRQRQASALVSNNIALNLNDNFNTSWDANSAANDFQCLELLNGTDILGTMGRLEELGEGDGPSLSYKLESPVSLASRADQQMVRILQTTLTGRLYHNATPVLSSYVYREAELTNTSGQDLLGGPLTAYLGGRFVGRAEVPTVTRGQTFVVGFGADPQLRTRRELVSQTEAVQGGNREITVKYALSLENYKDSVGSVRLLDRLPYSNRDGEIRVTLKSPSRPVSENKVYQRQERPKGILRWDLDVPAQATGDKAVTVEYEYTVEFDRKFQLGAPGSSPRLQQEFQELQKARMKY